MMPTVRSCHTSGSRSSEPQFPAASPASSDAGTVGSLATICVMRREASVSRRPSFGNLTGRSAATHAQQLVAVARSPEQGHLVGTELMGHRLPGGGEFGERASTRHGSHDALEGVLPHVASRRRLIARETDGEREAAGFRGVGADCRPACRRTGDDVALSVGDVEVCQAHQLVERLDALGADRGVAVPSESDERRDQRCSGGIGVDAGDQGAVKLDSSERAA